MKKLAIVAVIGLLIIVAQETRILQHWTVPVTAFMFLYAMIYLIFSSESKKVR